MGSHAGYSNARSTRPFPQALGELLRVQQGDPLGTVNLRAFFAQIPEYSYDALRKMVRGQLTLQPEAIEKMAAILGVPPEHFLEYRVWQIQEGLRRHPEVANEVYEMLMTSFELLDSKSEVSRKPARRPRHSARERKEPLEA